MLSDPLNIKVVENLNKILAKNIVLSDKQIDLNGLQYHHPSFYCLIEANFKNY